MALTKELIQKMEMVNELSDTLSDYVYGISKVRYDIFETIDGNYREEYLIVEFIGGSFCARCCTGDSRSEIFKAISELLNGGYYDEVPSYKKLMNSDEWVLLRPER